MSLRVAARKNARDVIKHVGRARFVVSEVLNEPLLHDVDLLLRLVVHDGGKLLAVFSDPFDTELRPSARLRLVPLRGLVPAIPAVAQNVGRIVDQPGIFRRLDR